MKENKEPYFANCNYKMKNPKMVKNTKMIKDEYFEKTYCENLRRLMRCSDCGFGQRLQIAG